MAGTSERMLRLLSLLQTHRFWSGSQLAERLEISERTLRRDVDRLRDLGYPVDAIRGHAGGYQLLAGAALPPLLVEDDEAVAIALALRTAAGGGVAGLEDSALRALTKVVSVMPPKLRRRMEAVASTSVQTVRRGPVIDAAALTTLARACQDHERVRFGYRGRQDTQLSSRFVEPHSVVNVGQRWYVVAFDLDRADWRTFRVDRVVEPQSTRVRCAPRTLPDGVGPIEFVRRNTSGLPRRHEVRLRVRRDATSVARTVMSWGRVDPVEFPGTDEPGALVTIGTDDLTVAIWLIIELDTEVIVENPPELTERLDRFVRGTAMGNPVPKSR